MICHDLRCIFVHIPRTGGTAIETWLCHTDWWDIKPATKHLTARQSRDIYAPYWDSYFKFSIVRHPASRVASMLHFADFFGLALAKDGSIDFTGYKDRHGALVTVEVDHRFYRRIDVVHADHQPGQVYGNILDCALDFIARYENISADMEHVRQHLGVETAMSDHRTMQSTQRKPDMTNPVTRAAIQQLYGEDFASYGYAP